jgi:hypothetical protein
MLMKKAMGAKVAVRFRGGRENKKKPSTHLSASRAARARISRPRRPARPGVGTRGSLRTRAPRPARLRISRTRASHPRLSCSSLLPINDTTLSSPQARTSVKAKAEFYGPNRGTFLVSGVRTSGVRAPAARGFASDDDDQGETTPSFSDRLAHTHPPLRTPPPAPLPEIRPATTGPLLGEHDPGLPDGRGEADILVAARDVGADAIDFFAGEAKIYEFAFPRPPCPHRCPMAPGRPPATAPG